MLHRCILNVACLNLFLLAGVSFAQAPTQTVLPPSEAATGSAPTLYRTPLGQPPDWHSAAEGAPDLTFVDPGLERPWTYFSAAASDGFFVQYDHLFWSISPPDKTVIGDPGSERLVNVEGIETFHANSLDTSFIDFQIDSAHRIEVGNAFGPYGWVFSLTTGSQEHEILASGVNFVPRDPGVTPDEKYMAGYTDTNGDGIDDDRNGNSIYGRNGLDLGTFSSDAGAYVAPLDGRPDVAAAPDSGDLLLFLISFGEFEARNRVDLTSLEFMLFRRHTATVDQLIQYSLGVRYLDIEDQFSMTGSGGFLSTSHWNTTVYNRVVGPQFAAQYAWQHGRLKLNLEGRFTAGVNFQEARQSGSIASEIQNLHGQPASLMPTAFSSGREESIFSPVGEWRAEAVLDLNPWLGFRMGYTGMVIGGYGHASTQVKYELPYFGLTDARNDALLVHAFTIGFEINR